MKSKIGRPRRLCEPMTHRVNFTSEPVSAEFETKEKAIFFARRHEFVWGEYDIVDLHSGLKVSGDERRKEKEAICFECDQKFNILESELDELKLTGLSLFARSARYNGFDK